MPPGPAAQLPGAPVSRLPPARRLAFSVWNTHCCWSATCSIMGGRAGAGRSQLATAPALATGSSQSAATAALQPAAVTAATGSGEPAPTASKTMKKRASMAAAPSRGPKGTRRLRQATYAGATIARSNRFCGEGAVGAVGAARGSFGCCRRDIGERERQSQGLIDRIAWERPPGSEATWSAPGSGR